MRRSSRPGEPLAVRWRRPMPRPNNWLVRRPSNSPIQAPPNPQFETREAKAHHLAGAEPFAVVLPAQAGVGH